MSRMIKGGRRTAAVAAVASAALLAAGCGGLEQTGPSAEGGSLGEAVNLEGASYTVGGKDFDEQLVLCEIGVAALESVQAEVTNGCNIAGTEAARNALTGGDIDLYWEYTGTAWISFLGETTPIADENEQYEVVKERDNEENQITWLTRTPFNNTYAMALASAKAEELGITTLTELAELINSGSPDARLCVESEFANRDDGLPGMAEAYGMEIPPDSVTQLDTGVVYEATAAGEQCTFGEVFTTDGRVAALDLTVLEDDKNFFPKYNAAVSIRNEAFQQNPAIADVFAPIAEALTEETMTALNAEVSAEGRDARTVAREWLQQEGFIGGS